MISGRAVRDAAGVEATQPEDAPGGPEAFPDGAGRAS